MRNLIFLLLFATNFLTYSCRDVPPETPQEEQSISREGELDDDGPMDVD